MKRAIIFDLDNCLCAADAMGRAAFEPVFQVLRATNKGTLSEEELEKALDELWGKSLDWVAEHYHFSQEMLDASWRVFKDLEVNVPMQGYDDLKILTELPVMRFLVTSGFQRWQESKIRALAFAPLFTRILIDAIDKPNRKGKQGLFQEILDEYHLKAEEVLVIGDNPDSEIDAGNKLGMETVQILRPRVKKGHSATHYIHGLNELKHLL